MATQSRILAWRIPWREAAGSGEVSTSGARGHVKIRDALLLDFEVVLL